jgi:hypothetical protein
MEFLVMGDYVLEKAAQPRYEEAGNWRKELKD